VAFRFEKMCQLGGGSCLAGSVDANDQKDFWMRRERTNGWGIDWKNTTNFFLRHFADVICADPRPGIALLQPFQDAQGHGHTNVRTYKQFFQLIPIDRLAGKMIDDVFEKFHSTTRAIPSESRGIPLRKL
jgi:hypothetical protein